jgi:hypothetical protein
VNKNIYGDKYEYKNEILGQGSFGKVYKMKNIQKSNE